MIYIDHPQQLELADNGTGIKKQYLDKIFEEFVTFHPRSKDTGKGIGLGLAICKAIITAHGGEIIGENNEDGGAKFSFWLWAGKEDSACSLISFAKLVILSSSNFPADSSIKLLAPAIPVNGVLRSWEILRSK